MEGKRIETGLAQINVQGRCGRLVDEAVHERDQVSELGGGSECRTYNSMASVPDIYDKKQIETMREASRSREQPPH